MIKKLILASAIAASFISSTSFAKTQGSYIGIDALTTKTTYYQKINYLENSTYGAAKISLKPTNSGSSQGIGLNYKYAFNLNGVFIAPGIIIEQNAFGSSKINGSYDSTLQNKNRYGAKVDFGYDLFEGFSPYLTGGYAAVSYKTNFYYYGDDGENLLKGSKKSHDFNWFGGAGLKIDLTKAVSLNVEYNYQPYTGKTKIDHQLNTYIEKSRFRSRMDIVKLGLSYNF